jgi:CarD family transcriptional regulator
MFSIGDKVIYGSKVVCSVSGIENKEVDNKTRDYYILKPIFESASTIFLPVDSDNIMKRLRGLLSTEEIHAAIETVSSEDTLWLDNKSECEERYKQILVENDHAAMLKLVVALYLRKERGKKLNGMDERVLKEAKQSLCDELAYILNLKREQVFPFIFEQIKTGAKSQKKD